MSFSKRSHVLLTVLLLASTIGSSLLFRRGASMDVEAGDDSANSATLHYWAISFGESGSQFSEIAATGDGGIIASGCDRCQSEDIAYWLVRFRRDGSIEWQKDYGDQFTSIVRTNDGGFLLGVGYFFASGDNDAGLIKIEADGRVAWRKQYGADRVDFFLDIEPVAGGGLVTAGYSGLASAPGAGNGPIWIMRLRDDGSIIWKKNFGDCCDGWAYAVQPTRDGGFIVAGDQNGVPYLLKLNASGAIIWHKTYQDDLGGAARSVVQTRDGGFAFSGYHIYRKDDLNVFPVPWVTKVNAAGDIQWQKLYRASDCCSLPISRAYDINTAPDGSLLLYAGADSRAALIMSLDVADGSVRWQRQYDGLPSWLPNLVSAGTSMAVALQLDDHVRLLKVDRQGAIGECPLVSQGQLVGFETFATAQDQPLAGRDSPAVVTTFDAPAVTDTSLSPEFQCQASIILDKTVYLPQCAR